MVLDPEFFHSADIIEFFWFGGVFLLMLCTSFRVFRLGEDFGNDESQISSDQGKNSNQYKATGAIQVVQKGDYSDDQIQSQNDAQNNNNAEVNQISLHDNQLPGKQPSDHFCIEFFEKLVIEHFPFLAVSLLSVVIGEAFIFCAFMATFYLVCVMLINQLEIFDKFEKKNIQEWAKHFKGLIIIIFFFNFWI